MFRTETTHSACKKCPIAKTAELIGDSVMLVMIRDLGMSPRRFSEFEKSLPGVSTRTLTKKIQMLESYALVIKKKYAEFPPRIEYTLTKKGRGLLKIIKTMETYGKTFLQD